MAYSALGSSLPDLVNTSFASLTASWGGPVTVTVNIKNLGSSTTIEPLALSPGAPGSADAGPFTVGVYASRSPFGFRGAVKVGSFDVSGVAQNSLDTVTQTLTLPQQPPRFPGSGGRIYLFTVVNDSGTVLETDRTNNGSNRSKVQIQAPLPELATVGLDLPPVMRPGDTVSPSIRIANLGPADTAPQGPVQIALVASTTRDFTAGSSIIAIYTVNNIPGLSQVANQGDVVGDANLIPQRNVVTLVAAPVTLPTSPSNYFVGVVIDPNNQIKQIQRVPQSARQAKALGLAREVGPNGLPPAGGVVAGGTANVPIFPIPFGGNPIGGTNTGIFPPPYPPQPTFTTGNTATALNTGSIAATNAGGAGTRAMAASIIARLRNGGRATRFGAGPVTATRVPVTPFPPASSTTDLTV